MLISTQFTTNGGQPATGLILTEINIYLYSRNKSTGATATIWNPVNPTEEVGAGVYTRDYTADPENYDYFGYAHYIGATSLDRNYAAQIGGQAPHEEVVANKVLNKPISDVEPSAGFRTLYGMICRLVNRYMVSGGIATAYKSDDATTLATQTINSDPTADPITGWDTN